MNPLDFIKDLDEFKFLAISEDKYTYMAENASKEENEIFVNGVSKLNMEKLVKKCAYESLKRKLMSRFGDMWDKVIDSPEFLESHPILKHAAENTEEKYNTDYIFMTVSPRPSVSFKDFKDTVDKAFKKIWITDCLWVFEQRGDNENKPVGYLPHMHALIYRKGKKMNEFKREFLSSFKKICDVDNPDTVDNIVNFKYCKDEDINKRREYMLGKKCDEYKQVKQKYDKVWREQIGVKDFYEIKKDA